MNLPPAPTLPTLPTLPSSPPRRGGRGGLTFVELVVAMALLSMILLGFAATSSVAARNREQSEQQRRAEQALSAWLAKLRELPLADLSDPTITSALHAGLATELRDVAWELVVCKDETGAGALSIDSTATTSVTAPAGLAFPIDLNGDGDVTDTDVPPTSAVFVPARLKLSWTNPAINSNLEVRLYVYFSGI